MEKHVYFVRHGQSEENFDKVFRGRDVALTETGITQAKAVAERIERLGIDALLSSTFPRALQTAQIIGERVSLSPQTSDLFSEWAGPSQVIGLHREHSDVRKAFDAIREAVDPNYRHADEETFLEMFDRAGRAFAFLEEHPAARIGVVTHGGFLKVLIGSMVFGHDFNKTIFHHMIGTMPTTNTGVTYVRYIGESPGWQLVTWNDQSHLG